MKKKITFIIPFTEKTGGIAVVLEYMYQLRKMGHEVNIFYPLIPYMCLIPESKPLWKSLLIWMIQLMQNLFRYTRKIIHHSNEFTVKPVLLINNYFIPNSDIILATAWPTAYDVAKLNSKKGVKFYLIQGYETWCGYNEKVHASYKLPLNLITISPFLTNKIKTVQHSEIRAEIYNGIRLDRFYPPVEKFFSNPKILMMAHELELKGTQDGLEALSKLKKECPDINITLFGICSKPKTDFDYKYVQNPNYEELLKLYQKANIFLSPSHSEGWGLPVMEAMACKCAVIATKTGCVPILNNGKNLIAVEKQNPMGIYKELRVLLKNTEKIAEIAESGYNVICNYTWENAALQLVKCLGKHSDI